MQNVYMMVEMNFPRAAAAEALKQTNNDVSMAIDVRMFSRTLQALQTCSVSVYIENWLGIFIQ